MRKKIVVYDVAAEYGGAETVLLYYYNKFSENTDRDYYFFVGKIEINDKNNIHVIRLPWVKKSWFHRLFADMIYMPIQIKKMKCDKVISLQNIGIPFIHSHQIVYNHNALPFTEKKYSIWNNKYLWFYQNIIGYITKKSVKKVDKIIVQTKWMKQEIVKQTGVNNKRIRVVPLSICNNYELSRNNLVLPITFFFPASPIIYKNHNIIINAVKLLREYHPYFKVVFTFDENENKLARKYAYEIKKYGLPIHLIGRVEHSVVEKYYKQSVLVFPSELETVGLPLVEAKLFNCPIIAIDMKYSKETLENYKNVFFFEADNAKKLSVIMKRFIITTNE